MSAKKTATKKPPKAQKPAKPAKGKAFAEKMAAARRAKEAARLNGPCPRGGKHEFAIDEEGDNVCTKCLEPGPKLKPGMPKTTDGAVKAKKHAKADKPAKAKRAPKPAGEKRLSALDAAAKVVEETGRAMNTRQLIEAMAERGYWTSPGGKTPWATLYSAIAREIVNDGDAARFVKTERGTFALRHQ
jgi:hypothetical protein